MRMAEGSEGQSQHSKSRGWKEKLSFFKGRANLTPVGDDFQQSSSTEKSQRFEVRWQPQPNEEECGQTCLRMLGYVEEDIPQGTGTNGRLTNWEFNNFPGAALVGFEVPRGQEERIDYSEYPHILLFEPRTDRIAPMHWVVRYKDKIYCPSTQVWEAAEYEAAFVDRVRRIYVVPFKGQRIPSEWYQQHALRETTTIKNDNQQLDGEIRAVSTQVREPHLATPVPFSPEDLTPEDFATIGTRLRQYVEEAIRADQEAAKTGKTPNNMPWVNFITEAAKLKRSLDRSQDLQHYLPAALLPSPSTMESNVVDSEPNASVTAGRELMEQSKVPSYPAGINWQESMIRAILVTIQALRTNAKESPHAWETFVRSLDDIQALLPPEAVEAIKGLAHLDLTDLPTSASTQELIEIGKHALTTPHEGDLWDHLNQLIPRLKRSGSTDANARALIQEPTNDQIRYTRMISVSALLQVLDAARNVYPEQANSKILALDDGIWNFALSNVKPSKDISKWNSNDWDIFMNNGALMKRLSPERWRRDVTITPEMWVKMKERLDQVRKEAELKRGRENWSEKYFWHLAQAMAELAREDDKDVRVIESPKK